MADFLSGDQLNHEIVKIISDPIDGIVLASPYMKFHDRIKRELIKLSGNPKIEIKVIIGKSDGNFKSSIDKDSLEFLMNLPNVQLYHENRLHAKFYGNGFDFILSSMNLYDFSQNTNIEFGVKLAAGTILDNRFEKEAFNFIQEVISQAELIYENVPVYEKKLLGLSKEYLGFKNILNKVDRKKRGIQEVIDEVIEEVKLKEGTKMGFCIRTGEPIPFNLKMPLSDKAFKTWSYFKDENFQEKYCHVTGEPSDGKTSFAKPVLHKNWNKAKQLSK